MVAELTMVAVIVTRVLMNFLRFLIRWQVTTYLLFVTPASLFANSPQSGKVPANLVLPGG